MQRLSLGSAGVLVAGLAWAGCSASNEVFDDEGDDPTSTSSSTSASTGGGDGSGGAGEGGAGAGTTNPCGQDCSAIETPDCFVSVCNTGQAAGPIGSCVVVADEDGVSCDDGLFCTTNDTCQAGVCTGGPPNDCGMMAPECEEVTCDETARTCGTAPLANGTSCTSPNLCEIGGTCQNGLCMGVPNDCFFSPVPNECFNAVCNPQNGMCEPVAGNDGDPCVDTTDLCSDGNTCSAGVCGGGGPKDCSFLTNGCDLGVCDPMSGVCGAQAVMDGQLCDDLDACTTGEICTTGMCGGGTPVTTCSGATTADGCCPSNCTVANDLDCACGIDDIIIREVSTASPDYVLVENTSSCPIDLDPITVCKDEGSSELCSDLPSFVLQPGAEVYLLESGAIPLPPAPAQTIILSFTMGWEGTPGAIFMCDGPCTNASAPNAIDAVIWQTSSPSSTVTLPPGINFTPGPVPGVSGIDDAVRRVATQGIFPNFFASDYVAQPATFD
ncbi:MAG: hypothetical protein AAF928_12100 [Myxococcota bacterium]